MGMSWLLQVSLHVLRSQQIIKGEKSNLELNRENWLHHPGMDEIRALTVSVLYIPERFQTAVTAGQFPLQARSGRRVLIPLWEGTALPPANTALENDLWYAQKGVYMGLIFRGQERFWVPAPKLLTSWDLKIITKFCICCFGILSTQLQAFLLSHGSLKYPFLFWIFLRRWHSLYIM